MRYWVSSGSTLGNVSNYFPRISFIFLGLPTFPSWNGIRRKNVGWLVTIPSPPQKRSTLIFWNQILKKFRPGLTIWWLTAMRLVEVLFVYIGQNYNLRCSKDWGSRLKRPRKNLVFCWKPSSMGLLHMGVLHLALTVL